MTPLTYPCPRCEGSGIVPLPPHMMRILELIARGFGDKEIGHLLKRSAGGVRVTLTGIREAVGPGLNRTQLAKLYWDHIHAPAEAAAEEETLP